MNYLAHIYLSGDNKELLLGNFMADAIKGNRFRYYAPEIQKGIMLHRFIDSFTDSHPVTAKSRSRLRDKHGKFSGIITDMFYDHFLAVKWKDYSDTDLDVYVSELYQLLNENQSVFPQKVNHMLSHMCRNNWLCSYRDISGIDRALKGISGRISFPCSIDSASEDLAEHYLEFCEDFSSFFPQLVFQVNNFLKNKQNQGYQQLYL
jgi:acyl carrier protein phosphodiesterase